MLIALALSATSLAQATSLRVCGQLPNLEAVALSPDGSRIVFVRTSEDSRAISVKSLADGKLLVNLRLGKQKLRGLRWADNTHLLITTSATSQPPRGLVGTQAEWFVLEVYDIDTHIAIMIPDASRLHGIRALDAISGQVMVRHVGGHTVVFIPGMYVRGRTLPALFRVDLQTGDEQVSREGSTDTRQWLVDAAGQVVAEQDYDDAHRRWTLEIPRDGQLQKAASGIDAIDFPQLLGFGPTADTLLMASTEHADAVWRLFSLSHGTFGPPLAESRTLDAATARFGTNPVELISVSDDFARCIVLVDSADGYRYELIDLNTNLTQRIGNVYDGLTTSLPVRRITYTAADGLQIPAYLTLPARPAGNLPLIVLPHGGPTTRDTAEFNWWAQALADQGYAVLQPNYRGSDLLNGHFLEAGFGQWGRKMQSDLSDGVHYLAQRGIADPARVCIVGASYGGYAALAGVTLESGVYRCAVSVAGLSDLRRWLLWVNDTHHSSDSNEQRYWDRFMDVRGPNDPVLLIHGRDDTVVPFEQSELMYDALRRADKDVQLVTLKHEDHWLSRSETRLQALRACVAFLRAHNPPR